MAVYIPIVSEFNSKGIDKAIKEFKSLETVGAKASFAIKKAAVPAGIAIAALGGFMVNAAKGAEEARQANQRLGNVLDSMGFEEATDRVSAYAESLEKTVAVDADVIKATQTKLATFGALTKSVGKAGGAFDRATLAALDLAAAGFGTAEGNAVQLGKALQNPIKGLASLTKSGIDFTDAEKEKITALVESGKLLEAQEIVLKAVEKQVGGTAKESASSFEKLKFAIAGISDTFGDMLLPAIDALAPAFAAFSAFAQANPVLLKVLVLAVGGLAAAILGVNAAMTIWSATTKAFTAVQMVFNAVMAMNPIGLVIVAIVALVAAIALAYTKFEGFRNLVSTVFAGIKTAVSATIGVVKTLFDGVLGYYKAIFNGIATLWNNTIGKLSFKVPSWVPGLGGKGFSVPSIPMLAEGGMVNSATLAVIGEAGPEVVIPLDRMREFGMGNGGGNNVTINVNGGDPNAVVQALRTYMRQNGSVPIKISNAF